MAGSCAYMCGGPLCVKQHMVSMPCITPIHPSQGYNHLTKVTRFGAVGTRMRSVARWMTKSDVQEADGTAAGLRCGDLGRSAYGVCICNVATVHLHDSPIFLCSKAARKHLPGTVNSRQPLPCPVL